MNYSNSTNNKLKSIIKLTLEIVIVATLFFSCKNSKAHYAEKNNDTINARPKIDTVALVSSLEQLYSYVPRYTVIEKCDLSNLGLKSIPVLLQYTIRILDLSHNDFRTTSSLRFLPTSLEELDLSFCNLGNVEPNDYKAKEQFSHLGLYQRLELEFRKRDFPKLKKLNVSYNNIFKLKVPEYTHVDKIKCQGYKIVKNKVREISSAKYVQRDTVRLVKSLDELFELAPNTVVLECDLSQQGLKDLPILRPYNIIRLNMEGNDLGNIRFSHYYPQDKYFLFFPESLVELNMSNCRLGEIERKLHERTNLWIRLSAVEMPHLRKVNLSGNWIEKLLITSPVEHIEASRNNLKELIIRTNTIKYLDVSHNWNMNPFIGVNPQDIDTLKTDSCAGGRKLEEKWWRLVGE